MAEVMDCRKLIFITIMSLGVGAEAVTLRPCSNSAVYKQSKVFYEIVNVALSAKDNRGLLRKNAKSLGIDKDAEQLRGSVGVVTCPGSEINSDGTHKHPFSTGGTVIGADDLVVVNAHTFIDDSGNVRDPLSKCYFQNQGPKAKRTSLMLKDGEAGLKEAIAAGYLSIGYTGRPKEKRVNDWAVVKMKEKLPGVKAFKIDVSLMKSLLHGCNDVEDPNCLETVAVSAYQQQMSDTDPNEPIAQSCKVMDIYPYQEDRSTWLLNNCSSTPGASASVNFLKDSTGNLVRDGEGHLIPFGIIVNSAAREKDHQPYAKTHNGVWTLNNSTMSMIIDGPLSVAIERMSKSGEIQTVENLDQMVTPPGSQTGF